MKKKSNEATDPNSPSIIEMAKARGNADKGSLVLIYDSIPAQRILKAWTYLNPVFKDRPLKPDENLSQGLYSLWDETVFDACKLADDAGVPLNQSIMIFNRLRSAYLIFPDGTISQHAQSLISAAMGAHLKTILE